MFGKSIEAIKEAVRLEDYAGEYTKLFFSGQSLRGACPVHGGENRSSFAVYPRKQRWFCFRCDEGGDLVDLCKAVEKHSELWTAMLSLAQRYGVELPRRPERWHQWQAEKDLTRAAMLDALARSYQRRFFRVFGDVILEGIEDETEREEEARRLFEDLHKVARFAARNRMDRNA